MYIYSSYPLNTNQSIFYIRSTSLQKFHLRNITKITILSLISLTGLNNFILFDLVKVIIKRPFYFHPMQKSVVESSEC